MDHDARLRAWHEQSSRLLDDALAILAGHEESPFSDGVLGEWMRELVCLRPEPRHAAPIAALLGRRDLLLREAGIELATTLLAHQPDAHAVIEGPLAHAIEDHPDAWILEAVVALLRRNFGVHAPPLVPVYRALAKVLARPPAPHPSGRAIMRNRHIEPRGELLVIFEQHVIQTLAPDERERIILPLLEARHGTRGFEATQRRILENMGFDADEHRARLARRP
jgi:hypothetical protein